MFVVMVGFYIVLNESFVFKKLGSADSSLHIYASLLILSQDSS